MLKIMTRPSQGVISGANRNAVKMKNGMLVGVDSGISR